jgi:hypothetical protein
MFRILLLLALVAVTYDAYSHQGFHTRAAIDGTIAGVHSLTQSVETRQPATAEQPT